MSPEDIFGDALPALQTPRLRLRHPRETDVDSVLRIFGDPEAMRYWSHEPFADVDTARSYLADIDRGFAERTLFQWAIALPATDELIGTVTLHQWSVDNRRAEVGFVLSPAHWGNGYAAEAVRAVLRFGFGPMNLHRVEADVDPRNVASTRLLERLGFREEGRLRDRWFTYGRFSDSVFYGLLSSEFANPP